MQSVVLFNQRIQKYLLWYIKLLVSNTDASNAITHQWYGNKTTPAIRQTIHATADEVVKG